jgi:hypothetical protein
LRLLLLGWFYCGWICGFRCWLSTWWGSGLWLGRFCGWIRGWIGRCWLRNFCWWIGRRWLWKCRRTRRICLFGFLHGYHLIMLLVGQRWNIRLCLDSPSQGWLSIFVSDQWPLDFDCLCHNQYQQNEKKKRQSLPDGDTVVACISWTSMISMTIRSPCPCEGSSFFCVSESSLKSHYHCRCERNIE